MRVWVIVDGCGVETEASSLVEAIDHFVASWWCGLPADAPRRQVFVDAQEIVTRCRACGSDDLSEICGGPDVECHECGAITEARVVQSIEEVPQPAAIIGA